MDFAKKLLNKYGWKEGEGLGKNSDGIAKPLKAKLKFDNAGFGADQAASDFNNHWWERVFNEAANNVKVAEQENGNIAIELKNSEDTVEISTKGYSVKKLKKAKTYGGNGEAGVLRSDSSYDNFLQAGTLTKGGTEVENPDRIMVSDIEVTQFKVLSDEELFRACGGRTAHKGARHGLKLSGKLARLQQQEEEMLAKMLAKGTTKEKEEITKTTDKKKKIKRDEGASVACEEAKQLEDLVSKKKKKKRKSEDDKETDEPQETATVDDEVASVEITKKKKKRKQTNILEEEDMEGDFPAEQTSHKLKKKKKSKA